MARPRKPTNILYLSGAFKKNPQRAEARANEPKPSAPAGDPPDWLNQSEREAWTWIVARCAPGVLGNSDDGILELTAGLRALLTQRNLDVKGRALLKACYAELGMTPASRSKVHARPGGEEKPKNAFAAV
jgi:hypothetical protein